MDIFDVLEKYGVTTKRDFTRARLKADFNQHVNTWRNYYNGDVPGTNTSTGFNGEAFFPIKRESMRLAKQIAIKWATMLFTEAFQVTLKNNTETEKFRQLEKQIAIKWATMLFTEAFQVTLKNDTETEKFRQLEKQIDFRTKLNKAAIYGYGMGTAALLASADILTDKETETVTGGKVKLDMLKYDSIFPLEFDVNDIRSIAFVREKQKKDSTVYTISIHTSESDRVTVETIKATVKGENIDFSAAETVKHEQTFNNRMYAIIKPNVINDHSDLLPFGQSIFADALAPCIDIDLAADLLRRDVREGAQVTFIGRDLLFENLKDGEKKKLFDNSPGRFFTIPQKLMQQGSTEVKQLFEKCIPEIRTDQCWQVVKDSLNWATLASGLGKGSLDIVPQQTATGVVHTEAEKMQSKSLHEQLLEGEIIKLVKGLCELSGLIGEPIDASEVNITWEDSIIVDTAEQKKLSLIEIEAGVISKEEYRVKYYGETPEEAKAKIEAIEPEGASFVRNNYQQDDTDMLSVS